ncbi:MAG: DUF4339 domain-containing protein [Bdellovibrionia bacterium]
MNDFIEKKWFIFVKDKHEGPFSIDEIHDKITKGTLAAETYVWKEGMSDWKMTSAQPEFQPIISQLKQKQQASISVGSPNPEAQGGFVQAASLSNTDTEIDISAMPGRNPGDMDGSIFGEKTDEQTSETQLLEKSLNQGNPFTRIFSAWKILVPLLIFIFIGLVGIQLYSDTTPQDEASEFRQTFMMTLAERLPFLDRWISTLPVLNVSPEEYEELKYAAKAKLEFAGPKFALGLSRKDLLFPELFLTSNLPDGAKFRVHIVGNPSTLLNWLTFEKETEIALNKKLSRTGRIHFQDGKPIPRGEYVISISASEDQPQPIKNLITSAPLSFQNLPAEIPKDIKILAFKTYFLGGPRDAVYIARLKEFHDRLREKASRELNELKQFSATLENQFDSTTTKFSALREGRSRPKQKKLWADFHQEWMKLEASLNTIFDDWTPAVIRDQFFYGTLYQLIHQLGQSIDRVHSFQNVFFTSAQDSKTLQIQIGETMASAQGTLILVKSKIEQAEKIPPTVNGMPRTEGL